MFLVKEGSCIVLHLSPPKTFDVVSPERLWEDLKPIFSYLSPIELELVHNALKLAFDEHDGQKRRSGEPFIIHPAEVARSLGELELDWESMAAGLLHDTFEDTHIVTFESIVKGETKVSRLGKVKCKNENDSVQDVKDDDLRQIFLAMTEEVICTFGGTVFVAIPLLVVSLATISYFQGGSSFGATQPMS